MDEEYEDDRTDIQEDDGTENEVGARPRRMSELNSGTKIQPIPAGTSFFLFSQDNK